VTVLCLAVPCCALLCAAKLNPTVLMGDGTAVQHMYVKSPAPQSRQQGRDGGEYTGLSAAAELAVLLVAQLRCFSARRASDLATHGLPLR